jgi:hypothetical protein
MADKTTKPSAEEKHARPVETTRAFSESCPDGFASDVPEWVAFCPECGAKLPLEDHVECAHYRGTGKGDSGEATTIECAYAQKPRIRPRTKTQE